MPTTLIDSTGKSPEKLILTTGGQLVTDRFGMSSARAVWFYKGARPEAQVALFSNHPRWTFLQLDKRTITRREDGDWDIVGDYFGVDGNPEPIYSLDIGTGQEPIETHPDFATLAGTPPSGGGTTSEGAVFDGDGLFVGFKSGDLVGVRSYLASSTTWRETLVTRTRPSGAELTNIGKIDTPNGPAPTPGGRNWLFASISYEQKARTYTVRREWILAGPGGWNADLYT
jgi:hypothetical protein